MKGTHPNEHAHHEFLQEIRRKRLSRGQKRYPENTSEGCPFLLEKAKQHYFSTPCLSTTTLLWSVNSRREGLDLPRRNQNA